RVKADPTDSPMRRRVYVRVLDIYGLPAAGVQVNLSFQPASPAVSLEPLPPTNDNGEAVTYISATEEVCVTLEAEVNGVVLREKPYICFGDNP
ncbi:MAG: hypothetical protein JXA37_08035, partial [Chloroflexia bacterium]|nr:hypothetical protein [Chloroflexia bacterium]